MVGAGISGLACAYALRQSGLDPVVLEAAERPGGFIQSVQCDGYLLELGPQSFSTTPSLRQLCQELGVASQLLAAPQHAPRFVLVGNQLRPVPLSPPAVFTSSLFSLATKWSIVRDLIGHSTPPQEEESFAAFVRRKFSPELLEKLAAPFVSGIYAGDPEELSVRAAFPQVWEAEKFAGSVIRGMKRASKARPDERATLLAFRNGNETLARALAKSLGSALRTGVRAQCLRSESASPGEHVLNVPRYLVECESPRGREDFVADQVVLATPAEESGRLVSELAPAAARELNAIEYAPVAVVSLGYAAMSIGRSLAGFGFLAPRSAGLRVLGTVWNSSLFPGRAPAGRVLLTSFVGGATDPAAASLAPGELSALVHREIAPILQISASPLFSNVTRWPRAIPQYNLGHAARLEAISGALTAQPGLHLTGNYIHGPAIGACVEHAQKVGAQIRAAITLAK